jgi:hypothetical protein
MRQTTAALVLIGALVVPTGSLAQHPAWITQLEGHLGWRISFSNVAQAVVDGASPSAVELGSGVVYGGRVLFPLTAAPTHHLGNVFVGLEALGSFGTDLRVVGTDAVVGKSDYYHGAVVVGLGKFVTATPANLTLHGALGLGVAHTAFDPNEGVAIVQEQNSVTSLLGTASMGIDASLGRALSVVTSANLSLGFRDPLDVSLVLLGGLALRLPLSGGPGH